MVEPIPVNMKKENISRLESKQFIQMKIHDSRGEKIKTDICLTKLFVPPILTIRAKPTCATIAPSLPLAAEMP